MGVGTRHMGNSLQRSPVMKNQNLTLDPARAAAIQSAVDEIHDEIDFRVPPFPFGTFMEKYGAYKVFEIDLPHGLDGTLDAHDDHCRVVHLRSENPRPRIRF